MRQGRLIWEEKIIDRIEPEELGDLMATMAENAFLEGAKVEVSHDIDGTFSVSTRHIIGSEWEEEE